MLHYCMTRNIKWALLTPLVCQPVHLRNLKMKFKKKLKRTKSACSMLPMTVFKYKITGALRRSGAHLKVCITKEWVYWWVHFTSSCPPIVYYVTGVNLYTLHAQIIPLAEFLNSLFLPRCPVSPENMIQAYFLHSERPVNHHQRLAVEQYELSFGFTGTSSGNCQETETYVVQACHTPRQPL